MTPSIVGIIRVPTLSSSAHIPQPNSRAYKVEADVQRDISPATGESLGHHRYPVRAGRHEFGNMLGRDSADRDDRNFHRAGHRADGFRTQRNLSPVRPSPRTQRSHLTRRPQAPRDEQRARQLGHSTGIGTRSKKGGRSYIVSDGRSTVGGR